MFNKTEQENLGTNSLNSCSVIDSGIFMIKRIIVDNQKFNLLFDSGAKTLFSEKVQHNALDHNKHV